MGQVGVELTTVLHRREDSEDLCQEGRGQAIVPFREESSYILI
jgi:hypothetical protein